MELVVPSIFNSKLKRWSYADLLLLRLIDWRRQDKPPDLKIATAVASMRGEAAGFFVMSSVECHQPIGRSDRNPKALRLWEARARLPSYVQDRGPLPVWSGPVRGS